MILSAHSYGGAVITKVATPDLPGFGFTEVPEGRKYAYSFDTLTGTLEAFTDALVLNRYANHHHLLRLTEEFGETTQTR